MVVLCSLLFGQSWISSISLLPCWALHPASHEQSLITILFRSKILKRIRLLVLSIWEVSMLMLVLFDTCLVDFTSYKDKVALYVVLHRPNDAL